MVVLVRRAEADEPAGQEREALAAQRAELQSLKRELAERIAAVREREEELRAALERVRAGETPVVLLPPAANPEQDRLAARAVALAERERLLALREAAVRSDNGDHVVAAELEQRARALEARAAELDARERAVAERETIPPDPDAARLAKIEARLDELRAVEEEFLRTRRELADRSDALAARERLVAQRERDLDEREDGWGGLDLHELEARLRNLERTRAAVEHARSFSGGFRKLEQHGTRRPPA